MRRAIYSGAAVRRAAWQFLTGKAISALLTFVILLWLVRLLPVADYGAYVLLIAGTELGFALAAVGLPWLAARHLPEYLLHGHGPALVGLCRRLILWQVVALSAFTVIVAFALESYLAWANLGQHRPAAWAALGLLFAEGLGRFLRDGLMPPLMLQGQVRFSLILRQVLFLSAIAFLAFADQTTLFLVVVAETAAAIFSTLTAAILLKHHLDTLRNHEGKPDWHEPSFSEQWHAALPMYGAHLVTLVYGPQVLLNIIQRALGAEAAALFGFLRTLQEQIARYLPATLLFTVLRPRLMASHIQEGMARMAHEANLSGKLSLLVLLPLIVLAALGGDALIALLSDQKFENGGAYFVGLLLVLLPFSQRQLIETVAVAAGKAGLCVMGSALGLLAMPLIFLLLYWGLGLWAPILVMLVGQMLFNATLLVGLAPSGYRADWQGTARLYVSAFVAWLVAHTILLAEESSPWLILAGLIACGVFLVMVWGLDGLNQDERASLSRLFGRRWIGG